MQKRILIFYLITSTNAGGTEKALYELITRIDRQRFLVCVCSVKRPGIFAPRLAEAADCFLSLGMPEKGSLHTLLCLPRAFFSLVRMLRLHRPAIIHCLLFRANIMGRLAARVAGISAVICSIRVLEQHARWKHIVDRVTSCMVDRYLAVSDAVRRFAEKRLRIPPEKIITIPNGIDCTKIPVAERERISATPVILVAARFERQKAHPVVIDAVKLLVAQGVFVQAQLFGEGPDEKAIRRRIDTEALGSCIHLRGVVDDILPYLQQADICVLPSLWEGQPNILLEAMAAGCPVVATRIPGVDELVVDGETGILCEPGSARSLTEALLHVIRHPREALRMAEKARRRVETLFSIDSTVKATVAVYEELLARHRNVSV